MEFTVQKMQHLINAGLLLDRGVPDSARSDETEGLPFLAIDETNAIEIDDAIRIRERKTGGFVVEAAIVDGSQLTGHEELIEDAIEWGYSRYSRRQGNRTMLPLPIVRKLELRGSHPHKALIVRQSFDADLQRTAEPDVVPAVIRTIAATPKTINAANPDELISELLDHTALLASANPGIDTWPKHLSAIAADKLGHKLVAFHMRLANLAMRQWTNTNGIPTINRAFSGQTTGGRQEGAKFTAEPEAAHAAIHPSEPLLYGNFTSPLRQAVSLVNHINAGHFLAGRTEQYDDHAELSRIADILNGHPLFTKLS